MDLQSALVCILVFVVSGAILLLISMFGMKEKSYEEALAEQRKLTSGLYGPSQKNKSKEKKQKKAGKKVKEKAPTIPEAETSEEVDSEQAPEVATTVPVSSTSNITAHHAKLHVEFEEPTVIDTPPPTHKKRTKKEKVRSILLNKEKSPVADTNVSNLPVNHFEKIHPKDECELLHAHQKEEAMHKQEHEPKVKASKAKRSVEKEPEKEPEQPKSKNSKGQKHQQAQQLPVVEVTSIGEPAAKLEPVKPEPVQKSAPVTQQTTVNSAKDKKKKKSEFNTLQQMTGGDRPGVNVSLLVPLVRKADLSRSEIQILIDLLLNKQHEAPTVLDEWSEGRADPVQKLKKQLAEKERALTAEQEAMVGVQNKLREVRAELNSERSRLLANCRSLEENIHVKQSELQAMAARNHTQNQKLQQMQAQLSEEMMTARKLREEHNAVQIQMKQMEMHLASINEQQQETEATFQTQLSQIRVDLQEQQNLKNQLTMELHTLHEKSVAEKEMLQERIRHFETQIHHYKAELEQKPDLARQLEESRRKLTELEHNIGMTHRHENELKLRCQQHLDEARRLEKTQAQSHEDLSKLRTEVNRLTTTNKQQQEEHDILLTQLRNEMTQQQNEISKLEAENGEASANKVKEVEILNLQNELSSLRAQLEEKDSLHVELEKTKKSIKDMETELEEQRNKNDDIKKQIKLEEQEHNRQFIQRLFPNVKIPNSDQWMSTAETLIMNHISSLQTSIVPSDDSTAVTKLQTQIVHYTTIIDDTEGMLKKLQSHIEHEERNWRKTLTEKDLEIESLKEKNKPQLQLVIDDFENRIKVEKQLRKDVEHEYQLLKTRIAPNPVTDSKHTQFGNLAEKEQLAELNSRLTEELSKERQRCLDLNDDLLRVQSQNSESLHSKPPQNHTSNGTSLEIIDSESASAN